VARALGGVDAVVSAAQALKGSGSVVVIGDPEGLGCDPVDCLLSRQASMAACTTTWPAQSLAAYDDVRRRVTQVGASFLGTRRLVCFQGRCPAVIGRTIAWADDNHLSAAYTASVTGAFRAALLEAIGEPPRGTADG
jgi:hypothetical protein